MNLLFGQQPLASNLPEASAQAPGLRPRPDHAIQAIQRALMVPAGAPLADHTSADMARRPVLDGLIATARAFRGQDHPLFDVLNAHVLFPSPMPGAES